MLCECKAAFVGTPLCVTMKLECEFGFVPRGVSFPFIGGRSPPTQLSSHVRALNCEH